MKIDFNDAEMLRAIAKIAACYVRHCGVPLSSTAPSVRYLCREHVPRAPVIVPRSDVVAVSGLPVNALYHLVVLHKDPGSTVLLAYVCLFHAFEFVVVVDDRCPVEGGIFVGHYVNVITGMSEVRSIQWLVNEIDVELWQEASMDSMEQRINLRLEPIFYRFRNRESVWLERAVGLAVLEFAKCKNSGVGDDDALLQARTAADRVLARYGMSCDHLRLELVRTVDNAATDPKGSDE